MALSEGFQVEYRGLLMGSGTDYDVVSFDPLSLPAMRTSDAPRPLTHGTFGGLDLMEGRRLVVELEVVGDTEAAFAANVEALLAATAPIRERDGELPLTFRLPEWDDDLRIECRPRRRSLGVDLDYSFQFARRVLVEFYASNPRVLGNTLNSESVGLSAGDPGHGFDHGFDLSFGGAGTSNVVVCTNEGTFETRPSVKITGPITDPSVENVTTGQILSLTGSVASGDFLRLDFLARTVLLNDTASRYSFVDDPSGWWQLEPGTNEVRFGGSSAGAPTMQIEWRSAWA